MIPRLSVVDMSKVNYYSSLSGFFFDLLRDSGVLRRGARGKNRGVFFFISRQLIWLNLRTLEGTRRRGSLFETCLRVGRGNRPKIRAETHKY